MADWYSRAREEDGSTDDEVAAEIRLRRDAADERCPHGFPAEHAAYCVDCRHAASWTVGEDDMHEPIGLRAALSWALDLLDMYDKEMVRRGDDPAKVYSPVHVSAKAKARRSLDTDAEMPTADELTAALIKIGLIEHGPARIDKPGAPIASAMPSSWGHALREALGRKP